MSHVQLCDPVDCSPLGSSVHGIFQARVLEWVAISFSTGFSQPGDWTRISWIGRWILDHWASWEKPLIHYSVGQIGNQKTPSSSFSFSRVLTMFQVLKNTRTIKASYAILPILEKSLYVSQIYTGSSIILVVIKILINILTEFELLNLLPD